MQSPTHLPRPPGRDHRVDFWRGIALAMIFVNHIPGNLWEHFTSRNYGFSDSAELFVFLAGYASAFAYGKPFLGGEWLRTAVRTLRRAGVLYMVHILLTLGAVALMCWAALALGYGGLMQTIGLNEFIQMPLEAMVGFATLGHQLGYVNILPMYSVLLLMLPVFLLLLRLGGPGLMLGASFALWVGSAVFRLNLPLFPLPGGWFFNPLAWQVIFSIGLYCGYCRYMQVSALPYRPGLYAAALAYLLVSFLTVQYDLYAWWTALPLPTQIVGNDKTFVTLPRLLHILALAYVFAHPSRSSPFARIGRDNLFTMLGRHSLPVFAVGTILSLVGQVIKYDRDQAFVFDTALIAGGLLIQFVLARYLDWWRDVNRTARKARAAAVAGAPIGAASANRAESIAPGLSGLHAGVNISPEPPR